MANSINTNVGAMLALSSMRTTQAALETASKQVQTGYLVADAMDNASTFSVAQGIRGNLQSYQAVQGSLATGVGLGTVTRAALTSISNVIGNIQAKITQLADSSISAEQRAIYKADYDALAGQIKTFIGLANYNGVNLLTDLAISRSFIADTSGSTMKLSGQEDIFIGYNIFRGNVDVASASAAVDSLSVLTTFKQLVDTTLATVSAETNALSGQSDFVNAIVDATRFGLGAIVDADIGKASASVQALQVRQQLGIQSMSIANQQPSILLGLLR